MVESDRAFRIRSPKEAVSVQMLLLASSRKSNFHINRRVEFIGSDHRCKFWEWIGDQARFSQGSCSNSLLDLSFQLFAPLLSMRALGWPQADCSSFRLTSAPCNVHRKTERLFQWLSRTLIFSPQESLEKSCLESY